MTASTAPIGTVDFFEGATLIKAGVPLTSGQATLNVKTTPGSHTYTANFVPDPRLAGRPARRHQARSW